MPSEIHICWQFCLKFCIYSNINVNTDAKFILYATIQFWQKLAYIIGKMDIIEWSSLQISVCAFYAIVLLLVVLATYLNVRSQKLNSSLLAAFSLSRNGLQVFKQLQPRQFNCLDGIKIIAFINVIISHLRCDTHGNLNFLAGSTGIDTLFFHSFCGRVASDAFLLISGTLLSYHFMKARQKV